MKSKKVLIVSRTFYPARSYGGIARVMYDLWTELTKDNIKVDCISSDVLDNKNRNHKKKDKSNGINIFYFKNLSNIIANKFKFPIPLGLGKRLKANIRQYDIVHFTDFRNIFSYIVYKYCKKGGIPYIVSPFGTMPYKFDYTRIIKKIFDITRANNFLKNAKYITWQTSHEIETIKNMGIVPNKLKLIPLMIDYDKFKKEKKHIKAWTIRKKYNIDSSAKFLLFVGRLHKYKATDLMINSFAQYQQRYTNSYLIIIWRDDGYKSKLESIIKELNIKRHIIFAGAVYYPETIKYYIDADIYFMIPSHYEETSTASLEALACGTPCIVTKQAEIPFLEQYWAWFVCKYQQGDIVNKLEKINNSKNEAEKLIKEKFDIKNIKKIFLNLYKFRWQTENLS